MIPIEDKNPHYILADALERCLKVHYYTSSHCSLPSHSNRVSDSLMALREVLLVRSLL